MIEAIFGVLFGIVAIIVVLSMGTIVLSAALMTLHFIGTMLLNPFVYIFTGHNLKAYEEYRDMPKEDDFF